MAGLRATDLEHTSSRLSPHLTFSWRNPGHHLADMTEVDCPAAFLHRDRNRRYSFAGRQPFGSSDAALSGRTVVSGCLVWTDCVTATPLANC
jgi:hypothetical protein